MGKGTYTVGRRGDLEECSLGPATHEVDRDRRVQDQVTVRRVQETLLLVVLQRQHRKVQVERHEADREADGRVGLGRGDVARVAEALRVDRARHEEERKREEREREEVVEVDEAVQDVEVPRLGAIQLGAGAGDGEEVVLDDVERNDGQLLVRRRVGQDDRNLWEELRSARRSLARDQPQGNIPRR